MNARSTMKEGPGLGTALEDGDVDPYDPVPLITEAVLRRQRRRRVLERFEQAFFVGVLLVLIAFTALVVLSQYSTASNAYSEEVLRPMQVEAQPAFALPEGPTDLVIDDGLGVDTTWIEQDPVMVPADVTDDGMALALDGEVDVEDGEALSESTVMVGDSGVIETGATAPQPVAVPNADEGDRGEDQAEVVDEPPYSWEKEMEARRVGVLRIRGNRAKDLQAVYREAGVVWGLDWEDQGERP